MMEKILVLALSFTTLSACITTRNSIEEQKKKKEVSERIENLSQGTASLDEKVAELQVQFRELNGRLEINEKQLAEKAASEEKRASQDEEKSKEMTGRFDLLIESVNKLEEKMNQVSAEISQLNEKVDKIEEAEKARALARQKKAEVPRAKKKGNYRQAEEDFSQKRWKEAALGYQKYRELNPKGNRYQRATFRMGLCFKNLKLADEAKVFFKEVVDRFPGSTYGKKAAAELKSLK